MSELLPYEEIKNAIFDFTSVAKWIIRVMMFLWQVTPTPAQLRAGTPSYFIRRHFDEAERTLSLINESHATSA